MSSGEVRAGAPGDGARMQRFMDEIFGVNQRSDQRRWAQAYLWALIHVSGKKTLRRIARASPLPTAAARGLHQFINASPWNWVPVRRRLARLVAARTTPHAWTVAELVIPKRGEHSAGVHRRVDAATGRGVNCQRALGLFLTSATHSYPVDWSLVLGGAWDSDRERRRRARIPGDEAGRTAADHVVRYAAGIAEQPQLPHLPWVLDLTACDDAAGVLAGLARLRVDVVCEVSADQQVVTGRHAPVVTTVSALMEVRHGRQTHVLLRQTPDGPVRAVPVHTHAETVGLPGPGGTEEAGSRPYRALERPDPEGRRPARYWLTTLTDRRVEENLRLARSHAAALSAVTTLGQRFGVLDYEGRSFPGWHHHMTMASAAYVYQRLPTARAGQAAPPDPPRTPAGALAGASN
ncbi:transposase [Streptomyces sp. NPDC005244]|uniref:IS701 family transposase n=1 Tax=Streptomyces sp. NPDC005244 TaxID=3364708 RepID=UPI0036B78756